MAELRIPVWTLGDRLRKSREDAQLSIQEMADKLGVHRNTVTGWEGDRPIKQGMIRAWAGICTVDLEWLEEGTIVLHDRPNSTTACDYVHRSEYPRLFDPDGLPDVIDLRDHIVGRTDEKEPVALYANAS